MSDKENYWFERWAEQKRWSAAWKRAAKKWRDYGLLADMSGKYAVECNKELYQRLQAAEKRIKELEQELRIRTIEKDAWRCMRNEEKKRVIELLIENADLRKRYEVQCDITMRIEERYQTAIKKNEIYAKGYDEIIEYLEGLENV